MASKAPQDLGVPFVLEDLITVQEPVTASSASFCAACHTDVEHAQRCSKCKNINYCSKSCQSDDWPSHKSLCRHFTHSTHPTPGNSRPCFVFLKYHDDGAPLDLHWYFPDTPRKDIKTIAFHNRFLTYWIQLSYDGNPDGERGLGVNEAIGGGFRGPVVALAYDAIQGLSVPALDADTTTLRPVLEYARLRTEYHGPVFVEQPQQRYTEKEWADLKSKAPAGVAWSPAS